MNQLFYIARRIWSCGFLVILFSALVAGISPLHNLNAQDMDEQPANLELEPGQEITLPQAVRIALANNRDIKRSLLSVESAETQVTNAWSSVIPSINTSMTYTRNIEVPVFFIPSDFTNPNSPLIPVRTGTDNNWVGNVSVNQTLFRGEAFVGISSAALFRLVQSESFRATTQQMVTQTRIDYYNVLIAKEQFELQQATVRRLEKNLNQNQARSRAGLIDDYAVLQIEVQLANARPNLQDARYQIQQAYRRLTLTLGLPLQYDFTVVGNLRKYDIAQDSTVADVNAHLKKINEMTPLVLDYNQTFIGQALDMRGDIRIMRARLDLKDREIFAIKSRYLPELTATYNLQWQASEPEEPDFFGSERERARSQSVALSVSLPIFQGFRRNANLEQVQIQKKDLNLQQETTRQQAKNDIETATESLQQALETSDARRRAVEQARRGYEIALTRLDNGIGTQLDVTNAEVQLQQAELNYAQMVFSYLTSKAQYDLAIGRVPFVKKDNQELMKIIGSQ